MPGHSGGSPLINMTRARSDSRGGVEWYLVNNANRGHKASNLKLSAATGSGTGYEESLASSARESIYVGCMPKYSEGSLCGASCQLLALAPHCFKRFSPECQVSYKLNLKVGGSTSAGNSKAKTQGLDLRAGTA